MSICGCPKSENNWRPLPQAQPAFHNTGSNFHTSCIAVFCRGYFTRQKCLPTSLTNYCITWNIIQELIKHAIQAEVCPLKTYGASHPSRFPHVVLSVEALISSSWSNLSYVMLLQHDVCSPALSVHRELQTRETGPSWERPHTKRKGVLCRFHSGP